MVDTVPSLAEIRAAAALVHGVMPATPQYVWPLLSARMGATVWVKHENHSPVGAFKIRGGIVYMDALRREQPGVRGVITATRGNHGQSIAFAARRFGLAATIVVPHGNSAEKNAAMRALGAELIEHGHDYQEAREEMERLAERRGLHEIASFDPLLVRGVATYALEFFEAVATLDIVYVPIGMGSGICGTIAVRDALGVGTEIVGVVAAGAEAYALSYEAGRVVKTERAETMADGVACRVPDADAVAAIVRGAARIVRVSEPEIAAAMHVYYTDTHNLAEGAAAVALAAALQERARIAGKTIGVIHSGGNVDLSDFAKTLASA